MVEAGPQVGYLLQANREGPNEDKSSVKDNYKKADVAINGGLGVYATKNLAIYTRYNLGLMNVSKLNDVDRKNRNLELGAAVRF
jgi:Outer membrane protein beta-barrel domain